jgi:hypothetical protein
LPISATTRPNGGVTLDVRCSKCAHRWRLDVNADGRIAGEDRE